MCGLCICDVMYYIRVVVYNICDVWFTVCICDVMYYIRVVVYNICDETYNFCDVWFIYL
jgi:hypothetical protein